MLTIFLAKFFGIYFIVIASALLLNCDRLSKDMQAMVKAKGMLTFMAIITVLLGITFVLMHNVWVLDWPVVVTLLCWMTFVKGAALLYFPDTGERFILALLKTKFACIAAWINVGLGLLLLAIGFGFLV